MILSKAKLAIGGVAIVSLLAAGYAVHQWGYTKGVAKERDLQAQAVLRWQEKTTQALRELETERSARQEVVRETIEVIRYVEDETGCIDRCPPGAVLERVYSGDSGACRPASD